jgi:hypothetical protein
LAVVTNRTKIWSNNDNGNYLSFVGIGVWSFDEDVMAPPFDLQNSLFAEIQVHSADIQ